MIREAAAEDLTGVARVHLATRRSAYAHILPHAVLESMTIGALRSWWENHLETSQAPHRLLVATTDSGDEPIVGFAHVRADAGSRGELFAIHVHPEAQGEGHGKSLLKTALRTLRFLGFEQARLWVLKDNHRARAFYERRGWTEVPHAHRLELISDVPVAEIAYEQSLIDPAS